MKNSSLWPPARFLQLDVCEVWPIIVAKNTADYYCKKYFRDIVKNTAENCCKNTADYCCKNTAHYCCRKYCRL